MGNTGYTATNTHMRVLDSVLHDVAPVAVDGLEQPSFLRHLLHDVLGGEDRLEIKPLRLHFEPLVNRLLNADQALLPFLQNGKIMQCFTLGKLIYQSSGQVSFQVTCPHKLFPASK